MSVTTFSSDIAAVRKRVGFLGAGWIGRNRMEALGRSGLIEIAAVADPVAECLRAAAEYAPQADRRGGLDELLKCSLDAVVIATPSALHAEQAIASFEAGLAVFCQKPLGRTLQEVMRVIQAAKKSDRLLGVDLSYRHLAASQIIRQMFLAGMIGEVFSINLIFHNAYGPNKPWFYDAAQSGGGCVIDLGIHLVDLALWTLDFPRVSKVSSALFAKGRPVKGRQDGVEDYATALLFFESGAVANLSCSWHLSAGCDAVIEASFYGSRGALSLRNINGSFYHFRAEWMRGTKRQTLTEPPDEWGGRAAVAWAKQLRESGRFDPAINQAAVVASVLDEIYDYQPES